MASRRRRRLTWIPRCSQFTPFGSAHLMTGITAATLPPLWPTSRSFPRRQEIPKQRVDGFQGMWRRKGGYAFPPSFVCSEMILRESLDFLVECLRSVAALLLFVFTSSPTPGHDGVSKIVILKVNISGLIRGMPSWEVRIYNSGIQKSRFRKR